jgi:hypothetical protein
MRKIFWFEMASLDGYHESEPAGLDWHHVADRSRLGAGHDHLA